MPILTISVPKNHTNNKYQTARDKDLASWNLMTLDEYRARGSKAKASTEPPPTDDGFTVVKSGRRSKKPTDKPVEAISKPKNAFANLHEVHLDAEVLPVKPASQSKSQKAAAAAWGTFTKRKPVPSQLTPNPEPKSEVLDQIADRWISEGKRSEGKRWADLEDSDDDW